MEDYPGRGLSDNGIAIGCQNNIEHSDERNDDDG